MAWRSRASLAELKSRVLPFGLEWRQSTGRQLTTARDGIDFLTAMKGREGFWAALVPGDPAAALPVDVAALRAALPSSELARDVGAEDYLRSIGLFEGEVVALITGLDEPGLLDAAIRSAFEEQTPQEVARALESVLDTDQSVLATEHYVGRLAESAGVGRSLGVLMGTAVLLVGTALGGCGPRSASPTPPSPASRTSQQSTPQPSPSRGSGEMSTPGPAPPEPPPPGPPGPPVPPPTPAYKGVSPRRRSAAAGRALPR